MHVASYSLPAVNLRVRKMSSTHLIPDVHECRLDDGVSAIKVPILQLQIERLIDCDAFSPCYIKPLVALCGFA